MLNTCTKIIQVNLNRSWAALDLLKQFLIEENVGLAIIAEPPSGLKKSPVCFVSCDGLAAILWRPDGTGSRLCRFGKHANFSSVYFNDLLIISCYISPNVGVDCFTDFLEELHSVIIAEIRAVMVCGDFNSRSVLWGASDTNRKGELVNRWAASLDLRLINTGGDYTCIWPQGCFVVDLTWASPNLLERISNWSVLRSVESLSDHLYIQFVLVDKSSNRIRAPPMRR